MPTLTPAEKIARQKEELTITARLLQGDTKAVVASDFNLTPGKVGLIFSATILKLRRDLGADVVFPNTPKKSYGDPRLNWPRALKECIRERDVLLKLIADFRMKHYGEIEKDNRMIAKPFESNRTRDFRSYERRGE